MAAESEEFERAWAQIVADLTADEHELRAQPDEADQSAEAPASVEGGDSEPLDGLAWAQSVDSDRSAETGAAPDATIASEPPGVAESAQPLRSTPGDADPAAYLDGWADEGHFTPPPPPELPAGSPATRLGWAAMLGGLTTLVLLTAVGWDPPRAVIWTAGVVTLAGFVTLIWQLPESRDDGWDDGAQV